MHATVGEFVFNNLIPATLGNIVGGALFIGLPYAWLYSETDGKVSEPSSTDLP